VSDHAQSPITGLIGELPYRMALAGGWIDQPFCSRHNPKPPGSMVVVSLKPTFHWMARAGMATGTRKVAARLWGSCLPATDPAALVATLYEAENRGKAEPSGTQDMIGLIYPGVSRLDYDHAHQAGVFPRHIESSNDPEVAGWLESVLQVLTVAPRPPGYNPLGEKNLDAGWIGRLGQSGKDCFGAILARDVRALGASMNECMECWATILPHTVRHATIDLDLMGLWRHYRVRYPGAMYSGCGGGYLYVASEEPVPGAFHVNVRTA
jgi:hypothetical protein